MRIAELERKAMEAINFCKSREPLAGGAAVLSALLPTARAQGYPTKPVHIVVGFSAGGVTDIVARLIGQRLSERLGQQFLIENRPGAGSSIAAEAVVRAPPDG
jgi:tripartite-type tricarboxylate transporter receptor subunit TctC